MQRSGLEMRIVNAGIVAVFALSSTYAHAQDVAVYTDGLLNNFQNFSFGGGTDFNNPTPFHDGPPAIAFVGNNNFGGNSVSFAHPSGSFASANYFALSFFAHGGASGGQKLKLLLQTNSAAASTSVLTSEVALDPYIAGGTIPANAWTQIQVPFSALQFINDGSFDRIDIRTAAVGGAQPVLYLDDVKLVQAASVAALFKNGFESNSVVAAPLLTLEPAVTDADVGCVGDRFSWRDSNNLPRVAVLAHNTGQNCPGGSRGGELRLFKYQSAPGVTRTVRAASTGAGGFGYVVAHPTNNAACTGAGNSSSLGHFTTGSFSRVFEGRHHAILRFTQNYPRYCTKLPPATNYSVPVTIDWLIASGRDNPLWAITYDLAAGGVPQNALEDDSRAPYGELLFDGAQTAGAHSQIAGVAWGERYKFVGTTNPLSFGSAWSYNALNSVPYVKLWATTVDASMGTVQTQTMTQHDAGGYFGTASWRKTSADGQACPGNYLMPCDFNWPYQSINYSLLGASTTNNTRLAWGANFGFLGQVQYPVMGSSDNAIGGPVGNGNPANNPYSAEARYASGWPRQSYSNFVVLGINSIDPIAAQVTQIETVQNAVLTAAVGSVVLSGPAGVNRPDLISYAPAGWNHVYGAFALAAAGLQVDANFNVAAGTLNKPLLIISNWNSAALPTTLRFRGLTLVQDVDYFPSVRASNSELWITLNRAVSGASNRLEILP